LRKIIATAAFVLSLLVVSATGAQATADPGSGYGSSVAASSSLVAELWEYRHTYESLTNCEFAGYAGVIIDQWIDYYCEWDDYRDGYALWVRVA
jgi:galactokinase/mevalonate kinase-like predicted kinase